MITVSDQFLAALRGPHVLAVTATAYPPGVAAIDLPVEDGAVTIDRTASQRRSLSLTVSDASLYPNVASDPISVYGTEIIVRRGVTFANNATETVPLGVFRVDTVERTIPAGGLIITGTDRSSQVTDERLLKPHTYQRALVTDLIQQLITDVYPSAVFNITTTDTTKMKRHTVDRDRWAEVQRLAQIIGCEVFPDATGIWVIQDVPDPSTAPIVWVVDAGANGVLVTATDALTRDSVPNTVVAIGDGPPTVFVAEGFNRVIGSGWGTSGSGDSWSIVTGASGDFDMQGGVGRIQAAAGDVKRAQITINDDPDVDATITVIFPNAITGGDLQASLGLRANAGGSSVIRLNITYDNATKHITAEPQKVISGSASSLGSPKDLGSYNAGDNVHLRLRLVGNKVKAKAWNQTEPKKWDWVATQSDLLGTGDVQIRAERGSGNTNSGSPQFTFDTLAATATATWYGIAQDLNPASATYALGVYGVVPVFYTSHHIKSQAQADKIAQRKLFDHLGESRTINFGAIVNPALDAGDAVQVVRPDGTHETHLIDTLDIPLTPDGEMTATTRSPEWVGAS